MGAGVNTVVVLPEVLTAGPGVAVFTSQPTPVTDPAPDEFISTPDRSCGSKPVLTYCRARVGLLRAD